MIINDHVCCFSFKTRALRHAKLIFESPLPLFYRASNIHTIATLLNRFDSVDCAWLKCRSIKHYSNARQLEL